VGGVEVPDLADVEACRACETLLGQLGRGRCEDGWGRAAGATATVTRQSRSTPKAMGRNVQSAYTSSWALRYRSADIHPCILRHGTKTRDHDHDALETRAAPTWNG
jgi:hypothetical protein